MNKSTLISIFAVIVVLVAAIAALNYQPRNSNNIDGVGTWNSTKKDTEAAALIDQGRNYYRAGDYEKAIVSYNAAVALEPENTNAYMGLYNVYYETGKYAEASIAIEKYLEIQPVIASAWVKYAELKWQKLKATYAEVSAIYERALVATKQAVDPGNLVDIHTNFALYLTAVGNYDAAIVHLQAAKELDPARAKIYDDEIAQLRKMKK